ncbi:MAG: CBS domain-containing protein, partial [Leptolyngbyaceae cyanobacterium bins.59]|nr:CBS domain-containing protein [Leptolyngbyaceae cyanobacterium bins.59]
SLYLPALESTIAPDPVLVCPTTPVLEVVSLMSQIHHRQCVLPGMTPVESDLPLYDPVSAVLVVENSQLVGIFTERDLVQMTTSNRELQGLRVADVMTHPVVTLTLTSDQTLFSALALLRQHQFRHLPVVDEHKQVVGMISLGTIRQALQPINLLKWKLVRDVMTSEVVCASGASTVLEIAHQMIQHQVSCVVVTDPDCLHLPSGRPYPLGILTERDIVQFQSLEMNLGEISASSVMSSPLFFVRSSDLLLQAQQAMQKQRIRRLVVVGDEGELLGIVTQTSLLRVFDPVEMYGVLEFLHRSVEQRTCELQQANRQLQAEICEREKVEQRLRSSEAKLQAALNHQQELNKLKSHFAAMASHDLRVPLNNILFASELLEHGGEKWPQEKKQQYIYRIQSAVRQMNQLLNDMMMISETEIGELKLHPEPLDLYDFCRELVEEMHLGTENKCPIHFISHSSLKRIPGHVGMDAKLLRQILVNLLSNAIKYSAPGCPVIFQLNLELTQAQFSIQDQGIGIPQEDQIHLFQAFHRAGNVGSIVGTGLGLAIVKRCVDAWNGTIEVNSAEGVGTTFVVALPVLQ